MTDVSKALAIQGWMTKPELQWLAQAAAEHKTIVEIGSFLGRSTRALADNAIGVVYAIDDWYGPRDVTIPEPKRNEIFEAFMSNMDGLQGRLHVVTADHGTAEIDATPDMVFIDGDHRHENVLRDIKRWYQRLAPGGLLCGHDAFLPEVWLATNEALGDQVSVAPNTTIWYQTKPLLPLAAHANGV